MSEAVLLNTTLGQGVEYNRLVEDHSARPKRIEVVALSVFGHRLRCR